MVLQKRLYYGFDGSQASPIPRGARSIRKRGPLRKKYVDSELCAFNLLASVADNLLHEQQSPTAASSEGICHKGSTLGIIKEERQFDKHKLVDLHKVHSSLEIGLDVVEIQNNEGGFSSGSASAITNSGCTEKTGVDEKKPIHDHGKEKFQSHIGEASFGIGSDTCSSEDPEFLDRNLSKSDKYVYNTDVKVHGDHYTCGFPSPCGNNVNLVSKDDDDNSSDCTKRRNSLKTIGDRRIKKLVAPRCSKAPPTMNFQNLSGVEMHTIYQNKRRVSKCQRSQRIYPFKKRKLLRTTSDDTTGRDYEDICEQLEKATNTSASEFETGELSEAAGQTAFFIPRESNVKLRIKSFKVPELFIELPETATVGTLKKTVMDAIKTLLGNGLHIGVLVQGRKIKDDSSTLLHSGISHDTLGFTLEPNSSQIHKPVSSEQPFIEVPPQPLSSLSKGKGAGDSKALVEVPESNKQALTLFPQTPPQPPPLEKSKTSEIAHRRMRRPFSVSEVEALVQAVEELGTGRWRDVKMRAFNNISHRTYVDLKDKWKTLVHTARISPQQRRGEPVPQELLDRVLAAHSHWSHRQAKHQSDACILV